MPLCNGHEATRQIRLMEEENERVWAEEEEESDAYAVADDSAAGGWPRVVSSSRRPPAWIIGLSAHAGVEDRDEGLAAGMNVFLTKVRLSRCRRIGATELRGSRSLPSWRCAFLGCL